MSYSEYLYSIRLIYQVGASLGSSAGKESTCNAGDLGSISGLGRFSGGGHGYPLQYLSGESHGQSSLAGYSAWGRKESDMTEQLSHSQYIRCLDFLMLLTAYILTVGNAMLATVLDTRCTKMNEPWCFIIHTCIIIHT